MMSFYDLYSALAKLVDNELKNTKKDTEIKMRFNGLKLKDGEKYVTLSAEPQTWQDILDIVKTYSHIGPELRSYTTVFPEQAKTACEELQELVNKNQKKLTTTQDNFNTIQILVKEYCDFGYSGLKKLVEKQANIDEARYNDLNIKCREAAEQIKAAL
jgi:hypothetical protein